MRRTPMVRNKDYESKILSPFFASTVTLIGIRHYNTKFNNFGRVALMFMMTDKMGSDEILFIQTLFDITNKEELEMITRSPSNIANLPKEVFNKVFMPIVSKTKPGENSFASSFDFKRSMLVPSTQEYYDIDGIYTDENTKTEVIKPVKLSKANWIRISQLMYWFIAKLPILNTDIFVDRRYDAMKEFKVTGMIFDGSADIALNAKETIIMAHFTLFTDNTLQSQFGINIPCTPVPGKLRRNHLDDKVYTERYVNDDRLSPDRVFSITSPDKFAALISGSLDGKELWMLTIDDKMAKEIHWLDWGHYIYYNKGEKL